MNINVKNYLELRTKLFNEHVVVRYSQKKFPSYRHIPGVTPHPIANENGHNFGKKQEIFNHLTRNSWMQNDVYLYGIDLFNNKFYWEAHETLEDLWMNENDLNLKLFLQGIIQISAAYLKWLQGLSLGMSKLSLKGLEKLQRISQTEPFVCGIKLKDFIKLNQKFFNDDFKNDLPPPQIELYFINN